MNKLTIHAVKVDDVFFISSSQRNYYRDLKDYYFDGAKPEKSFSDNWFIIKKQPTHIINKQSQPDINYRFCLIDETLESENRPLEISREDVCYQASCGEWIWKDEYAQYQSLYVLVSDKQPMIDVEVEFEWTEIGSVEPFNPPAHFSYPSGKEWRSYASKHENCYVRRNSIQHQDIDKAIFPSFLIHTKPCRLTQKDAYAIIREHVKTNIDPQFARVSSDYDFSFVVMKQITLAKPFESTRTYKPFGKRKSITQKIMNTVREQTIFTMKEDNGKWYNVPEFEGRDEDELKERIDEYLKQLMAEINEPIAECSYCCGTGFMLPKEGKWTL